jgi:hypothetical protein
VTDDTEHELHRVRRSSLSSELDAASQVFARRTSSELRTVDAEEVGVVREDVGDRGVEMPDEHALDRDAAHSLLEQLHERAERRVVDACGNGQRAHDITAPARRCRR